MLCLAALLLCALRAFHCVHCLRSAHFPSDSLNHLQAVFVFCADGQAVKDIKHEIGMLQQLRNKYIVSYYGTWVRS